MRHFVLPAVLLSAALVPAPAAAATLAPAVQRDLQCFMLYAIGVAEAKNANDAKVQQAASLGLTYFLGKLKVEAPTLVLGDAIRQEADSLTGNPKTKEIGQSCDSEFQQAGVEMTTLGKELTGKSDDTPSK